MKSFTLVLLMIALLFVALPVFAQEAEVTEEAVVEEPVGIEAPVPEAVIVPVSTELDTAFAGQFAVFVTVVITALWNLIYIPVASPFVELMTAITKRVPALKNTSAPKIGFFFTILAWLGFVLMTQLGYGDRFADAITAIVTLASVIFGIPVTQALSRNIYDFAQANSIPVFGYSRPALAASNSSQGEKVVLTELEPARD